MSINPGQVTKPVNISYIYITDNAEINPADNTNAIFVNIAADKTITLPDLDVVILGFTYWIKRLDNTSHTLTILPLMGQNIDNYTSLDMSGNEELALTAVGVKWSVMRGGQNFVTSSRDVATLTPILGSIVYNTNAGYGIGTGYYISDGVTWSPISTGAMVHTAGVITGNGSSGSPIVLAPGVLGNVTQYNGTVWNLGQSLTSFTIYVDAQYGDDLTAQPFNPYFPYATIDAACSYATNNTAVNVVYVRTGTYTVNTSLIPGINPYSMYFEPSFVTCNVTPFDDLGTGAMGNIDGEAIFDLNGCGFMNLNAPAVSLITVRISDLIGLMGGDAIIITTTAVNFECTSIELSGSGTENVLNISNSFNTFIADFVILDGNNLGIMNIGANNNYISIIDLRLRNTCGLLTDNSGGFISIFIDSMRKIANPVANGFRVGGTAGALKVRINQTYNYTNYAYYVTGGKQILIDEKYSFPSIVVDGTVGFNANIEANFHSINSSGLPNILNITGAVGGLISIKAKSAIGSVVNNTTNSNLTLLMDVDNLSVSGVPILTSATGNVVYTTKNTTLSGPGTAFTISTGKCLINMGSLQNSTVALLMSVLGGVVTLNASDITLTGSLASISAGTLTVNVPIIVTGANTLLYAGASTLNVNNSRITTQTANNKVLTVTPGSGVIRLQNCVFIANAVNAMASNVLFAIYAYPSVLVNAASSNISYTVGSEIVNAAIV